MDNHSEIDKYILQFPPGIREMLEQIRGIIRNAAPAAAETISYGMPAFRQNGILVYFAAHKNHIGFYPTGSGIAAFIDELGDYNWSKGAIQFPLNRPLPEDLITRIVIFRVRENLLKKKKNKKSG